MPHKQVVPAEAVRRQCPTCHKMFKPMTEPLWRVNWMQHTAMSLRHRRYLALSGSKA